MCGEDLTTGIRYASKLVRGAKRQPQMTHLLRVKYSMPVCSDQPMASFDLSSNFMTDQMG
jgi:hypothetical protein